MEGCTSPLVVKFADTQKEKEQKKIQQIQANLWNLASNINIPLGQTATSVTTPILPNPPQQPSPVLGADAITPASIQLLQQLQAVGLQQQLLQGEDMSQIYRPDQRNFICSANRDRCYGSKLLITKKYCEIIQLNIVLCIMF